MKIKISKAQWEEIGKTTGWMKTAQAGTGIPYSLLETIIMQGDNGLSLKTMGQSELEEAKTLEKNGFIKKENRRGDGIYQVYVINKDKFNEMGWSHNLGLDIGKRLGGARFLIKEAISSILDVPNAPNTPVIKNTPVTGKYTSKKYQCTECGNIVETGTNHWGECYPICNKCRKQTVHKCLEPIPKGYGVPEKWKMVKVRDLDKLGK